MDNKQINCILNLCKILYKHKVEYLIVGGTAVSYYGFNRISTESSGKPLEKYDLDFWYNPNYENYFNLLNAIEELGIDVSKHKKEVAPKPKESYFKYKFDIFNVDFLPVILGLKDLLIPILIERP